MRTYIIILISLICVASSAVAETNPIARQKGVNAFFALDREWDQKAILYARDEIETGEKMDQDEPWLLIARARLYLVLGYKSHSNYSSEAVDEAYSLAKRAAKKAPKDGSILTFYANQLYKKGENEKAWSILQDAMKIDPNNPYPIYSVANKIADAKDAKSLEKWIEKAKAVDKDTRYKDWQIDLEKSLCVLKRDYACVEAKHKEKIVHDPSNPWAHGNYAKYLQWAKRYKESKAEYQKALTLMDYAMARQGLAEVEAILKAQAIKP